MRRLLLLVPLLVLLSACAGTPPVATHPARAALELGAPVPPLAEPDTVAMAGARLGPPGGAEGAGRRHVGR